MCVVLVRAVVVVVVVHKYALKQWRRQLEKVGVKEIFSLLCEQ